MEYDFWHDRWQRGEIGFHQVQTNPHLQRFWKKLPAPAGGRVLVPLCGKTLDMCWLVAQGHAVLGVEVSELAVTSFFEENDLTPEKQAAGSFTHWRSGEVEILCGDFFALAPELVGKVDAVYDRASLIALPPSMRKDYAAKMAELLPHAPPTLLITFEYDQQEMNGPPFSVHEPEVQDLFGSRYRVTHLHTEDILAANPQFRAKGLTGLHEKVYLLGA